VRNRKMTKRAAAVAACALTAVAGLSACGSSGPSNELTWYINPDGGGSDPTKGGQAQIAKECTDAAKGEYSIKIQLLPNSASDQRQQVERRLAAGDAGMDLMSLDPVFVAEFAEPGWLAEVPAQYKDKLTEDAVKPIIDAATWKGKLVAAPMWANTQLLWYRKSVAQQAGIDMTKDVTWDQLIEAAQKTKKTIGVQSKLYEGYMVWINALIEGAGGHIIAKNPDNAKTMELGLDSDAGKKAAEVIKKVSSSGVGGPAMGSLDETNAVSLFTNPGTSGFMLNWPYVWNAVPAANKEIGADMAFARYPQTVAGQPSKPPLGGIEVGVNKASTKQDKAWKAIQCIISPEHQKLYMLKSGNPAARKSVYDDPEVTKAFPNGLAAMIRTSLDEGAPRPLTQYYGDVSTAIQKTYSPPSSVSSSTPGAAADLIKRVLKGEALL
jgi:multiple sugar transport system substrate-binding protein